MFEFFDIFLGAFETAWSLVVGFVETMIKAVELYLSSNAFILQLLPYLPTYMGSCALIVIAVSVVKVILGR